MKLGLLFPGQGSQEIGMGKDLAETYPAAAEVYRLADQVLGEDLSGLIFNGPASTLTLTSNAQPSIVTASLAVARCFPADRFGKVVACAGHSLGEFTALTWSGALKAEDTIQLVRNRGLYMQQAVSEGDGSMAAVIGLGSQAVRAICKETEEVWIANLNAPQQVVISGKTEAVGAVAEKALAAGAKRVVPLPVSGPFHSPLMTPAADRLAKDLAAVSISNPRVPVISNVTAKPVENSSGIKDLLVRQMTSPVQWAESILTMQDMGVDVFVELGPGRVLTGLVKRILPKAACVAIGNVNSLTEAETFFKQHGGEA